MCLCPYIPIGSLIFRFLHRFAGGIVARIFSLSPHCEKCKLRHYRLDRLIKCPRPLRRLASRIELSNKHHIAESQTANDGAEEVANAGPCGCGNSKKPDKVKANHV